MLAVSPILASSTGAAPGIREIITVPFRGKREPRAVREADNLGEELPPGPGIDLGLCRY